MLKPAELQRVSELVKQGKGPHAVRREMKFLSVNRAVRAIARAKKHGADLEWSLVHVHRRKAVNPADPKTRPTLEQIQRVLLDILAGKKTYGPGLTRWLCRLGNANGLEPLVAQLVKENERVRGFAWTPEKQKRLRASKVARPSSSSGGKE